MVDGVSKSNGTQQTSQSGSSEDFKTYGEKLNKTMPEQTTTVAQKKEAIRIKKQIMQHPGCPAESKAELQKEINTLYKEIDHIENMNSSLFD